MAAALGSLHPLVAALGAEAAPSLSFLAERWTAHDEWRTAARAKLRDLLLYRPPPCALDPQVRRARPFRSFVHIFLRWKDTRDG